MVTYRDPIHGDIRFSGLLERIIDTEEFQRLGEVMQLGMTHKVYTSATHTRLAHSIGVAYLAGEMAKRLRVSDEDVLLIQVAALLHDVGHYDFSHALEAIAPQHHEENGWGIIRGYVTLPGRESGKIHALLREAGIDPERVVGLLAGTSNMPAFYRSIISSAVIDVDRMDYLARDTYFTGAVIGTIDTDRLLSVLVVDPRTQQLGIEEKGIASIEQFLAARRHMYQQVYRHPSVFSAEVMLRRAVSDGIEVAKPFLYGDDALIARLATADATSTRELVRRLRRGKHAFHTAAYAVTTSSAPAEREHAQRLCDETTPRTLERRILEEIGSAPHEIIVTFGTPTKPKPLPFFPVLRSDGSWEDVYSLSAIARAIASEEREQPLLTLHVAPELDERTRARAIDLITSF